MRMDQLTTILDEDGDEVVTARILRGPEPRVLSTETKEGRDYMPLPAKNGRARLPDRLRILQHPEAMAWVK